MRYNDMRELMRNISPDVEIDGAEVGNGKTVAPASKPANSSTRVVLEERFLANWASIGGMLPQREYVFHPTRKWRFDFAFIDKKIAIEIQGGLYSANSGHRSMAGVTRDYEKLNAATLSGWRVFQLTSRMVGDLEYLEKILDFVQSTDKKRGGIGRLRL